MVIPGIYVQGYSMYECTGIQVYSITSGATALQCIALYRYTVIHQRSFCNLFCSCQLYNPILSIALQVIYSLKPKGGSILHFTDVVNAQQILQRHWAWDAQQISRQSPSQLLIFYSLMSKICDCRQSAISSPWNRCDVMSFKQRSLRSLRNAQIQSFVILQA